MPQLIAMVIVVVGAMIYMFQTFGGTGDKIEGVAQKTSVITEINNIKSGILLANKSGDITFDTTLSDLGALGYFAPQINTQLADSAALSTPVTNVYNAISFGADNSMEISLVVPVESSTDANDKPGIYVNLGDGSLSKNAGFLETQMVNDLNSTSSFDQHQTAATFNATLDAKGDLVTPVTAVTSTTPTSALDGKFVVYFKDFEAGLVK